MRKQSLLKSDLLEMIQVWDFLSHARREPNKSLLYQRNVLAQEMGTFTAKLKKEEQMRKQRAGFEIMLLLPPSLLP